MADNGEVYDDAEIAVEVNDSESKTSAISEKIAALEQEKLQLVPENEIIKERLEKLKQSIEDSRNEKLELQKKLDEAEFETRALGSISARAAELEGEASRLRGDLSKALSDLEGSNSEASQLRSAVFELENSEKEKEMRIKAVEEEKNLLVSKVEKLEASGEDRKAEKEAKEQEIVALKKKLAELEALVTDNEDLGKEIAKLEMAKKGVEAKEMQLKERLLEIEKKLKENERALDDVHVNGIPVAEGNNNRSFGSKLEWPLVAGSSLAAIGLAIAVIYLRKTAT